MAISVYRPSFGVLFWTRSFRLKSSSRRLLLGPFAAGADESSIVLVLWFAILSQQSSQL